MSGWLMWPLNMYDCIGSSGSLCRFAVLIRVELTVIQNLWADRVGKARLDIRSAPEVVMRAIERSKRGHELFGRVREAPELVVYELKTLT